MATRRWLLALFSSLALGFGLPAVAQSLTFYLVSHGGPGDPFWDPVIKGAMDAAKLLGVKVIYDSPETQGNVAGVIRLLNAAIAAHPNGIGVTVDNTQGFAAPLQEAKRLGIPVIAFNTVPSPANLNETPYLGYVGQDNYVAGQGVARAAIRMFHLKAGDLVAIINHQAGNISLTSRAQGIESVLKPMGVQVDVLATPGSDPAQSEAIIQSFIAKHPQVKALLTLGPLGYTPAAKVLESDGLVGKVGLSGMDLDQAGLQLIQKGVMAFTWDQQPYVQGFMTVVELYLKAKYGFNPPAFYDTGVGLIDRANVGQWIRLVQEGVD
jgi:simple sugar transport system substrate-binding protein